MQKVKWQIKIQNGILHPGTPRLRMTKEERKWIPACAGMTTFARLGMTPHQITAEAYLVRGKQLGILNVKQRNGE